MNIFNNPDPNPNNKRVSCRNIVITIIVLSLVFILVMSLIVFPAMHLDAYDRKKDDYFSARDDLCNCKKEAYYMPIGFNRTQKIMECDIYHTNSALVDIAPISKFFGYAPYRPNKFDENENNSKGCNYDILIGIVICWIYLIAVFISVFTFILKVVIYCIS